MSSSPQPPRSNKEGWEEGCLGCCWLGPTALGQDWRMCRISPGLPVPTSWVLFLGFSILAATQTPVRVVWTPVSLCGLRALLGAPNRGLQVPARKLPWDINQAAVLTPSKTYLRNLPFHPALCFLERRIPSYAVAYARNPRVFSSANFPQIPEPVTNSCQLFLLKSFLSPSSLHHSATCFGLSHQGFSPGLLLTWAAPHLGSYSPGLLVPWAAYSLQLLLTWASTLMGSNSSPALLQRIFCDTIRMTIQSVVFLKIQLNTPDHARIPPELPVTSQLNFRFITWPRLNSPPFSSGWPF